MKNNTIEFDQSGCATVFGPLAHEFYFTKVIFNKLCEERPEELKIIRPNLLKSIGWKSLVVKKINDSTYQVEIL